jgi:hypothetical protein
MAPKFGLTDTQDDAQLTLVYQMLTRARPELLGSQ